MGGERRRVVMWWWWMAVVVVLLLGSSQEVEGLFECMKGCPSRCQKEYHESLYVCAIFCGMRCTCTGGAGNCSILGSKRVGNGENQDLQLLDAARAQAAVAGTSRPKS